MTKDAGLTGQRILLLEDDYYLATDTARALTQAGAATVWRCSNEEDARDLMLNAAPSGALLDIHTGSGRSFAVARLLRTTGVPFIFVTGYDRDVIPEEFNGVVRLQKPVEHHEMVGTIAGEIGAKACVSPGPQSVR